MSAIQWVSVGLSAAAIAVSGYTVWQTRRTVRSMRERDARAKAHRDEPPS